MTLAFRDNRVRLIVLCSVLLLTGLIFVFSAGAMQSERLHIGDLYFFKKQVVSIGIGFAAMYVAYKIPLKTWRTLLPFLYFGTAAALLTVFLFKPLNGAHRWIVLPGFNIQPSELAKFTVVLYLAHYLEKKEDKLKDFGKGFLPASIMLGILGACIIREPDYGTTILIICIGFTMFLIGGASLKHIFAVIGFIAPIIAVGLMSGYRRDRILTFLDPYADAGEKGYQLIQSLTAVGSGGIFGKGLGNSTQKLYFLPEAHTDFIYAIIAEETGIIGSMLLVGVIAAFFITVVKVALKHENKYKRLLTFGLGYCLLIQGLFHIAVVTGMLPTKGIGLPFISYGGSNMVFSLFMTGVILRSAYEIEAEEA